jgi:hypothetical protein
MTDSSLISVSSMGLSLVLFFAQLLLDLALIDCFLLDPRLLIDQFLLD